MFAYCIMDTRHWDIRNHGAFHQDGKTIIDENSRKLSPTQIIPTFY